MRNLLHFPSADTRRARRAQREERAQLRAELASYRTKAERSELDAILDRHRDEDAEQVRRLIA